MKRVRPIYRASSVAGYMADCEPHPKTKHAEVPLPTQGGLRLQKDSGAIVG